MLWPKIPTLSELDPWLRKMEKHAGSCVIVTFELQPGVEQAATKIAWLSDHERAFVRKAMINVNMARGKLEKPLLTDQPE
jgi:hypothetical protein